MKRSPCPEREGRVPVTFPETKGAIPVVRSRGMSGLGFHGQLGMCGGGGGEGAVQSHCKMQSHCKRHTKTCNLLGQIGTCLCVWSDLPGVVCFSVAEDAALGVFQGTARQAFLHDGCVCVQRALLVAAASLPLDVIAPTQLHQASVKLCGSCGNRGV